MIVSKTKYGKMPPCPNMKAKIKGDAGEYCVRGFDWYENKVLIDRACGKEWVDISKVCLSTASQSDES